MSHESENADLTQNIVSRVAETAIANQIDSASKIDVKLDSDMLGMLQGKANSLEIMGEKIVAVKDIRLEKIDITCQDISVNLTQALLGKVAFEQPGNFQVKLVFIESDCDRLLNSEYVRILLQNLDLEIDSQPASFYLQQSKCCLTLQDKISLSATLVLQRGQQTSSAPFEISFQLEQNGAEIGFCGGQYLTARTMTLDETVAIMNKIRDLLYLRRFENDDLVFNINQIEIKDKQLIVQANTEIKRLPDSISQSIKSVSSEINN